MSRYDQKFDVAFDYPVFFTDGVFDDGNGDLEEAIRRREPDRRHRFLAVIDDGVARAWPDLPDRIAAYARRRERYLEQAADPVIVPGGEAAKNDPHAPARLHRRFFEIGLDRQSYVLVVGGGAVQDLAGYAASTTHRGLRVVRVPTTVLAQNDSGVGVKNGVNAFGVKNFLGSFAPPFAVINDARFLSTLAPRDLAAGLSESVKVALIRDAEFYAWLRGNALRLARFETDALAEAVRRGALLHLRHIATSGDPFEMGSARPLDFGHWAAHKLETLSDFTLRHGEAVAIGMAVDVRYSALAGLLPESDAEDICRLMESLGLRLWHDALASRAADGRLAVLGGLADFREHLGGELTVTLLSGIGRGVEVHEMDETRILSAIGWLKAREARR